MSKTGVLIMNTGTPDAPTEEAIRAFLSEMLMDRALVNVPPLIWRPILNHAILPKRPAKTLKRYESVWTPEGSRYLLISLRQRDLLQKALSSEGEMPVELGMRYGNPSTAAGLEKLRERGCERVVVLPLYPQDALVTTQTCIDHATMQARAISARTGWAPTLVPVRGYCMHPRFLDALAALVLDHWTPGEDGRLLFSFHSTLVKDIKHGDPYYDQAVCTCAEVAARIGLPEDRWEVGWQSRFDSRRWLSPPPGEILSRWAAEGAANIALVCPGFAADCIETLIDIGIEERKTFENHCAASGRLQKTPMVAYIPSLNTRSDHIEALAAIVRSALET